MLNIHVLKYFCNCVIFIIHTLVFSCITYTLPHSIPSFQGEAAMSLPGELVSYLQSLLDKDVTTERDEANTSDWILVAHVIDRFCLFLFFALTIILTLFLVIITQVNK